MRFATNSEVTYRNDLPNCATCAPICADHGPNGKRKDHVGDINRVVGLKIMQANNTRCLFFHKTRQQFSNSRLGANGPRAGVLPVCDKITNHQCSATSSGCYRSWALNVHGLQEAGFINYKGEDFAGMKKSQSIANTYDARRVSRESQSSWNHPQSLASRFAQV